MSRLSLAQQLAELSEPAPVDLDPEDVQAGVYPEDESTIDESMAREHYVDVAPSVIRKLHDSVTDPKYSGVRTTRKQLFGDADEEVEADHEGTSFDGSVPSQSEDGDESDGQEGREEDEEDEDASDSSQYEVPRREEEPSDLAGTTQLHEPASNGVNEAPPNEDLTSTLRSSRESDRKKGKAVARQITIWDNLLDARIQLQKVITAANKLPNGTYLQNLSSHQSAREALDIMFAEAAALSEELFSLQEGLLERNESITAPPRKRRKVDPKQNGSYDHADLLRDLSADASALELSYHTHLVHTLAKWSAKVQAVAPSVLLGNRTAFNKDDKSKADVVSMVNEIFRTDGSKLLNRTRIRRSKSKRLGPIDVQDRRSDAHDGEDDEREDPEVFDDLDFYQQLLRDVIRARGGDGQGGEQDWIAQQKERKAKRKLKVDTKASKGRKLRYEVHAKLQNFMVPVPVSHGGWHDEQIDGLFSSLLGSG